MSDATNSLREERSPRLSAARLELKLAWFPIQRVFAGLLLLTAMPLFALLYPLVRLSSPGPFLYGQRRPGLHGAPFTAWKIRTMRQGADRDPTAARSTRADSPMVTSIGRILRDVKLDELPQLWNILRGEMEFVGPRPLAFSLQRELEGKIPGFAARLSVRPGITSMPQVCILESNVQEQVVADWTMRFEAERHYIRNKSARYDLIILFLTVLYIGRKLVNRLLSKLRRPHS